MRILFFLVFLFLLWANTSYSQQPLRPQKEFPTDQTLDTSTYNRNKKFNKRIKDSVLINDYKIISYKYDTTYIDTSLSIRKDYKMNYLRKDYFELLTFGNMGRTYNQLGYDFSKTALYPHIGMRSKHYAYQEIEDIPYYHVATPTSELYYKNGFEQGQVLDAFITLNTSPRLNFSIGYKGLRSLGKYQNVLVSTGNFKLTSNYRSRDERYLMRAHISSQDITNQENGGLTPESVDFFKNGDQEFRDRGRLEVFFEDAESVLIGKRYHLEHSYALSAKKDSTRLSNLRLGHVFSYETKQFVFSQDNPNAYFGDALVNGAIRDEARLKTMSNEFSISYLSPLLGQWKFAVLNYDLNYYLNSIYYLADGTKIPQRIENNEWALGGNWNYKIGNIRLEAELRTAVTGDQGGQLFRASGAYTFKDKYQFKVDYRASSSAPQFSMQLYQSDYKAYNWYTEFKNEKRQQLHLGITTPYFGDLSAEYNLVDNYLYFSQDTFVEENATLNTKPFQLNSSLGYLKLRYNYEFQLGKWALDNSIQYQNVRDDQDVLNVPDLIVRSTLYYSNHLFKRALFLQTGMTFNYFTSYYMNGYDPLIGEFYTQDREKIGDFPRLDFFLNIKVRNTRVYLKAEHFNSSFTGYNYFSAPGYPYRDFIVRFGLVWNFFN